MSARSALRAATAEQHEAVDRLFSGFDLSAREGYCAFLSAQAGPFLSAERELDLGGMETILPDWPERRRGALLIADLEELGGSPSEAPAISLSDAAAKLGAAYVLEGSRLGGKLLRQQVPSDAPRRFLDHEGPAGGWRKLMKALDEFLVDPERLAAAVVSAQTMFQLFEAAGRRKMETVSA